MCNSFQTYQDLKENPRIFCSKNCRTQVIHVLKFLILYIFLSKICPFEAEACWQLAKINLENCSVANTVFALGVVPLAQEDLWKLSSDKREVFFLFIAIYCLISTQTHCNQRVEIAGH